MKKVTRCIYWLKPDKSHVYPCQYIGKLHTLDEGCGGFRSKCHAWEEVNKNERQNFNID